MKVIPKTEVFLQTLPPRRGMISRIGGESQLVEDARLVAEAAPEVVAYHVMLRAARDVVGSGEVEEVEGRDEVREDGVGFPMIAHHNKIAPLLHISSCTRKKTLAHDDRAVT